MKILRKVSKEDLRRHLYDIDKNDNFLYEEINKTTFGIFQFTGNTAEEMVRRVKPKNFEELVIINACSRPGTSSFLDNYINYVENPKYPKQVNNFLKSTRGNIIFQEQIMSVLNEFGGFSLEKTNEARGILKKLSKATKKQEDIDRWKELIDEFSTNAKEKGFNENHVRNFINDLEQLSNYSFNRSHAYAYSYIALMDIYLAKYFRQYFYSANLTNEATKKDELKDAIQAVSAENFNILPPDINKSGRYFTPEEKNIRFGIEAIKGIGEKPIETILANRPYKNIIDFIIKNLETRSVTKRITQALICGGAFDELISGNRIKYSKIAEEFYDKKKSKKIPELLESLWASIEDNLICNETTQSDIIKFDEDFLGGNYFYSIFPKEIEEDVKKKTITYNLTKLRESERKIGYVPLYCSASKEHLQKNGEMMLFFNGEDILGEKVSIPIFGSYYKYIKDKFRGDNDFYWLMLFFEENTIKFGAPKFTKNNIKERMLKRIDYGEKT